MLSPGGSAERTRGLDLGADDVLSLPFDPHELLSRVRSQLRNKRIADEFRDGCAWRGESKRYPAGGNSSQRGTADASGWRTRDRCRLQSRGLIFFFFYRRTQQENIRVYAAITRLQTGMLTATTVDGTFTSGP